MLTIKMATKGFLTINDTCWLYPIDDIDIALARTSIPYTRDRNTIVCPTLADLSEICYAIFFQTAQSNPVGNGGYYVGRGTLLEDLGKEMELQLSTGPVVLRWRLVQQKTPQSALPPGNQGNSPNGTIGYVPTFCSLGNGAVGTNFDPVRLARI
jgi:hypothetical protein